jgi:soluble lytic murein transglycosylase-like protein
VASAAQKFAAIGILAGAGWMLWRWWNPPGQVEVIDGARLDYSPLQETFDSSPIWGTSGFDIFDTNDQYNALGLNMGSASAGGAEFVKRQWVTPAKGLQFENLFVDASKKHGLPAGLLSRLAFQESSYNPNAQGPMTQYGRAQGLMQIMKQWHPTVKNPLDPVEAIYYAAGYLAKLKKQFGTWDKALAGYNWGPENFRKFLIKHGENWLAAMKVANDETYNYVTRISTDTGIYPAGIGTGAAGIA